MIKILKKNGEEQSFNGEKIKRAIRKSAERVCVTLTEKEEKKVVDIVRKQLQYNEVAVPVSTIHNMVEVALDNINQNVAKSYREYRDNKNQFASMLDRVYSKKLSLNFVGDRSNANSDSSLVSTIRAITYNELNSELYKKFFLTQKEERAMSDGYIYIHDRGSRLDTINCCLFDMKSLIDGGFVMGNLDYTEPKTLDVAFDLIGDATINAASFQYGGFTLPEIDKLLAPYAQKSYKLYYNEYIGIVGNENDETKVEADRYATNKVRREFEQGFQSWEMKFNSVASSRGDYPFTALTFGTGTGKFELMCSSIALKVRKEGQGKDGYKHPVLFPKLSFFYDEELHGEGKPYEWLFNEALECSMKTMYPDFISCTGDGYAPYIYRKYNKTISRMGALAGHEHLYVKFNDDTVKDVTIKELFDYIKEKKLSLNGRSAQIAFNAKCLERQNIELPKVSKINGAVQQSGVYKITYLPQDYTYIGSTSNIGRRFIEHKYNIRHYGGLDTGMNFADCNLDNYVFEIVSICENYKEEEKKLIETVPNINFKGISQRYYKLPTSRKDILVRPSFKQNENIKQELFDIDELNIKVYDRDNKWTRIKHIFKNDKKNSPFMMHIYYKEHDKEFCLSCTEDHPLWIGSEFVRADELTTNDCIYRADGLKMPITKITWHSEVVDSYDIGTETGSFIGSDVIMHNCRANLSPWYVKGGMEPLDETDEPVYAGRFNMGAISLNIPMISLKAKKEDKDFFDVFTYYLDMVRGIHKRTFEYLSHKKAGINPLGFCQGGFLNGNKNPDEELGEDFLRPMTMSFGVIGLNESSIVETGKPIHIDNSWAKKVLEFINEYADKYKRIDNILYAIYGTPGESLVGTIVEQIRKKYGIINGVSDRDYCTNSFHAPVYADITPIEKQDIEYPLFHLCNGGNIAYARMRSNYNFEAFKAITKRAMKMGLYWGNNQQLDYCEKCGHSFIDSDICPKCGSEHITRIERMNGYISYASVRGKTLFSDHKLSEFKDRISM